MGRSVAVLGDTNGDRFTDIAVGDPNSCDASFCNGHTGGRVRIHSGLDGSVLQTLVSETNHFSSLGFAVAAAGDVNLDGHADLIVGDPMWGPMPQCGLGRAVVYSGIDGAIIHTLLGSGVPNGYEQFGYSVASAGDVDADGIPDVIVGSIRGLNFNQVQAGYARIFSGADGATLYTLYGIPPRSAWAGPSPG